MSDLRDSFKRSKKPSNRRVFESRKEFIVRDLKNKGYEHGEALVAANASLRHGVGYGELFLGQSSNSFGNVFLFLMFILLLPVAAYYLLLLWITGSLNRKMRNKTKAYRLMLLSVLAAPGLYNLYLKRPFVAFLQFLIAAPSYGFLIYMLFSFHGEHILALPELLFSYLSPSLVLGLFILVLDALRMEYRIERSNR